MTPFRSVPPRTVIALSLALALLGCGGSGEKLPVDDVVAARLEADFVNRCDRLRLVGVPEEVADLEAWCPLPGEGENAAPYYEMAFQIQDPSRKLMALLQAGSLPSHRYPVDWNAADTTLMVPFAFTEGMLDAGRFLSLATHHAVIQDDPIQALQALLAAYRMVRHAAQDSFLINQTSRIACQRAATQSLVYTLAHLEIPESQLAELQDAVEAAYQPEALPRAWFVEKALKKGRDPFKGDALRWYYDDARGLAQLRITWTTVAVERYLRRNGAPPEHLEALVPDFLNAVPDDPFTAQPLGYAADDRGYVVFSTGGSGTAPLSDVPLDRYDDLRQTAVYLPFEKKLPVEGAVPAVAPVPAPHA